MEATQDHLGWSNFQHANNIEASQACHNSTLFDMCLYDHEECYKQERGKHVLLNGKLPQERALEHGIIVDHML